MADNDGKPGGAAGGDSNGNDGGDDKGGGAAAPEPRGLDAVHAQVMAEHGEEFSKPEGEEDEDLDGDGSGSGDGGAAGAAGDDDAGDGTGGGSADDDKDKGGKKDGEDGDGAGDGGEEEDDDASGAAGAAGDDDEPAAGAGDDKDPELPEAPKQPEIEQDVTKPGSYKTKFVDEEGKEYFVSDVAELPDDFEPQSQKAYGLAMQDLFRNQSKFEADTNKYQVDKAAYDQQVQIVEYRKSWTADIKALTDDKTLPADPKERQKVIDGVYKLMQEEMNAGRMIERWSTAHEIYTSREAKKAADKTATDTAAAEAAKTKAAEDAKNKKGGKVMGGGAGGASSTGGAASRPLVREGVPRGVTLDQVHQSTIAKMKG